MEPVMPRRSRPENRQRPLFDIVPAAFPPTRYQGSKAKLVGAISSHLEALEFETCLDAFGGTGAVSYQLKALGKRVTYNDFLRANYLFAKALVENDDTRISEQEIEALLEPTPDHNRPSMIQDTFRGIYFTDEENDWIDRMCFRIRALSDPYKNALVFFALAQACIVKRPYNLFHRRNLYLRFADVPRSFGNKASWDRSFTDWFRVFADEANSAVFRGQHHCTAVNKDVGELAGTYDLIYLDPPYISSRGVGVDYLHFYHFIEGMSRYDEWPQLVDYRSKHRRIRSSANPWIDRRRIHSALDGLMGRFDRGAIVLSYRSDGIPSGNELLALLKRHRPHVEVHSLGSYKYVLSTNSRSDELLFIGR